jgi:hypothetical protein
MLLINDCHFGAVRKGGTTPASQVGIRNYLVREYQRILYTTDLTHLVVLGDLFDDFTVAQRDWLDVFSMLKGWVDTGNTLTLVAGNHDVSAKGDRISSFNTLANVLMSFNDARVQVIDIGQADYVSKGAYAIAHCHNQDLFGLELQKALDLAPKWLLLHCNYDNHFAQESDHSLDLSAEWAQKFAAIGTQVVLAHEHQKRTVGNVHVLGNQFPTSVADCLGNDHKYAHELDDEGLHTWNVWYGEGEDGFQLVDWRELDPAVKAGFVRVTGTATAPEAASVIAAISDFRRKCADTVFVVSNAVAIDGIVSPEELPEQFSAAEKFDVLAFIESNLEADEMEAVRELLKE